MLVQVDLHGLHVEEALQVLEQHLLTLGGLGCPGGVLLQVCCVSCALRFNFMPSVATSSPGAISISKLFLTKYTQSTVSLQVHCYSGMVVPM